MAANADIIPHVEPTLNATFQPGRKTYSLQNVATAAVERAIIATVLMMRSEGLG